MCGTFAQVRCATCRGCHRGTLLREHRHPTCRWLGADQNIRAVRQGSRANATTDTTAHATQANATTDRIVWPSGCGRTGVGRTGTIAWPHRGKCPHSGVLCSKIRPLACPYATPRLHTTLSLSKSHNLRKKNQKKLKCTEENVVSVTTRAHMLTCALGLATQQAALMDGNSVTAKLGNVWAALTVCDKHRYMSAYDTCLPLSCQWLPFFKAISVAVVAPSRVTSMYGSYAAAAVCGAICLGRAQGIRGLYI